MGNSRQWFPQIKGIRRVGGNLARIPTCAGLSERLLKVIERLKLVPAGIGRLELIDPASSFSKLWRDVFNALGRNGTEVQQRTLPSHRHLVIWASPRKRYWVKISAR